MVPTLAGMLGNGVSLGVAGHAMDGVFGRHSFFIVREWFAEQGPGDKTWACSLWVQTGVLGRKRLGSRATLLGQSSRPKWIWAHWCRTLAPP